MFDDLKDEFEEEAAEEVARKALLSGSRDRSVESLILRYPYAAAVYAIGALNGRWIEAEPVIVADAKAAYHYAKHVLKSRWPEAEPVLIGDAYWGAVYCMHFGGEPQLKPG